MSHTHDSWNAYRVIPALKVARLSLLDLFGGGASNQIIAARKDYKVQKKESSKGK